MDQAERIILADCGETSSATPTSDASRQAALHLHDLQGIGLRRLYPYEYRAWLLGHRIGLATNSFFRALLAIVLCTFLMGCSGTTLSVQRVKPFGASQGWSWIDGPDILDTHLQLYKRINGAGEELINLGWQRAIFGTLKRSNATLSLTIHELRDSDAARTLLAKEEYAGSQEIDVGEKGRYWTTNLATEGIIFLKDNRFCELVIDKKEAREQLTALAVSLEKLLLSP